ncbi:MAG: transporter [Solirubrobacterales bacterium]
MTDRGLSLIVLVCTVGMLTTSPGAWAQEQEEDSPQWQYGLSLSYLTGDYGEDSNTDIIYTAATVKRYLQKGDITLTVPYVDISADGVIFVDGTAEAVGTGEGGSGLGDVILKGRYYAIEQEGLMPFVDLVGSVKFPTADEDEGLGTGEFDFTFLVELARRLKNDAWTVLGEFGYTFVGEPDDYDVQNRWLYSVGLAYELNPKVTLSGYLDGRTAIVEDNDNPLSVLLAGEYKYHSDLRFDTLLEVGLNDGAPDFGITFGVRKRM